MRDYLRLWERGYGSNSNCWGATQYIAGGRLRIVRDYEMIEWLKLNAVKVRRPALGDIMVLASSKELTKESIEHSAVRVSPTHYFHQQGIAGPFLVQPLYIIKNTYRCYGTYITYWRLK